MSKTIGQAALDTGCPASTIRYYERIGLLSPPERGANGYRYYDSNAIQRLQFAHRCRELGFSVASVTKLLQLADHPHDRCSDIDQLIAEQLALTQQRLTQLQNLNRQLKHLQSCCVGGQQIAECGILSSLTGT